MYTIQNNSNTLVIVLHEIYGINQHMKQFCQLLSAEKVDVICPNLLQLEEPFEYTEENIAYSHFMENIGFSNAAEQVKNILNDVKNKYENVLIVGFSVGATIAWLCSKEDGVDGIVGYYGSRIRDYTEVKPKCPALLFFPEKEVSFDVDQLISSLLTKNVEVLKWKGEHGFSNPFSTKYNEESANGAFNTMVCFCQKLRS